MWTNESTVWWKPGPGMTPQVGHGPPRQSCVVCCSKLVLTMAWIIWVDNKDVSSAALIKSQLITCKVGLERTVLRSSLDHIKVTNRQLIIFLFVWNCTEELIWGVSFITHILSLVSQLIWFEISNFHEPRQLKWKWICSEQICQFIIIYRSRRCSRPASRPCTFVINQSLFLTLKIFLLLKWQFFSFLWKTTRNLSIYLSIYLSI